MRRLALLLVVLLGVADPAGAAGPVLVPGWNVASGQAETIDAQGRGVVAFARGEYVWLASVAPDGRIVNVGRIEAPRSVDGPGDIGVAINDGGDVVATYAQFTGEQPAGPDGYGFVIRPWAARFPWGGPPGFGRQLLGGSVNVDVARPALNPLGTAVLPFAGSAVRTGSSVQGAAVFGASGPSRIESPAGQRGGAPLSVAVDGQGRFVTAWDVGGRLEIGRADASGRFARFERPLAGGRPLPAAPVLVDRAGDELVVWERRDQRRHRGWHEVVAAQRRAGAPTFAAPRVLTRGRMRLNAVAIGSNGGAAVLVADAVRAAVVRRVALGTFAPPIVLPGRTRSFSRSRTLAVDERGRVLVSYRVELSANGVVGAARTVRIAGDGSVRRADAKDCDPLGLAGAPNGAALLTLSCPRNADGDGDGDVDPIGGAVQTFSPDQP